MQLLDNSTDSSLLLGKEPNSTSSSDHVSQVFLDCNQHSKRTSVRWIAVGCALFTCALLLTAYLVWSMNPSDPKPPPPPRKFLRLSGQVLDEDNVPIVYASVVLKNPLRERYSNSSGMFFFDGLDQNTEYQLKMSHEDFEMVEKTVELFSIDVFDVTKLKAKIPVIYGKVVDRDSYKELQGVSVTLQCPNDDVKRTYTSDTGKFKLTARKGDCKLTFSRDGYLQLVEYIKVTKAAHEITFSMSVRPELKMIAIDEVSMKRLSGVQVYLSNSHYTGISTTDTYGEVTFDVSNGQYAYSASRQGYVTDSGNVKVDGRTIRTIRLKSS
ncbi:hypothetical protein RCL1_005189 [Eukaryota sp. TZLM3-RCL]